MAPADTRHRAKRHPDHGTVMALADNTRHRAERRAAQGGAPTHEVRFHPIANWQQGQKVAIIGGGRYHTLDNLTAWNTSEDAKSVIDKACARGTRQLSEVPDSQASIDMGPSPPNATRALLASPHIGIVALSPPEEQLRDSIITTPHTQDRSSCLACHNLHTGPPDSRCSPSSFRDSSSIDLDSDSGSDSSSSSGSNSSDSVVTAVPRGRTLSRRDTTSAPSPTRSQSSPAPSWGDPVFDRDQIQGPFYTTEVLFDKVGALGRTTDNILVQVDGLGDQLHRQLEDVERQAKENKEHLEERLVEVERAAALRHEEVIQMMQCSQPARPPTRPPEAWPGGLGLGRPETAWAGPGLTS
ncbi:hypothetical protein EV426DRAFT_710571 [Tirmania nivea]|nr:hypothetical protein EV426DRAFT_710571 [Tirmania nivea]